MTNTLKLIICGLIAALFATSVHAQTSVVRRSTLLVEDLERSVAFYEAIGFTKWLETGGDRNPEGGSLPLNDKPARSDFVIMAGQHDYIAMIGLLKYSKPDLPATRDRADGTIGTSDIVIMMETDDIDAVEANLKEMGAIFLQEKEDYSVRSPVGMKFGANMFFYDPDGHVIEMSMVRRVEPIEDEN